MMGRALRFCDRAMGVLVVCAGFIAIGQLSGELIGRIIDSAWADAPQVVAIVARATIAMLVIVWAKLAMGRASVSSAPARCSVNVHVYEDEIATTCRCGATSDADAHGGAA